MICLFGLQILFCAYLTYLKLKIFLLQELDIDTMSLVDPEMDKDENPEMGFDVTDSEVKKKKNSWLPNFVILAHLCRAKIKKKSRKKQLVLLLKEFEFFG